jgi:hypothetical protein
MSEELKPVVVVTDEPIMYQNSRVYFHDQFKQDPDFLAMVPMFEGQRQRALDTGLYLHMMYSPRSIYRKLPEAERIKMTMKDPRILEKNWLSHASKDARFERLRDKYVRLVLTPGERMYIGLIETVERLKDELSETGFGADQADPFQAIERGKKLYAAEKEINTMINDEKLRKVGKNYSPRKFESPIRS